MNETNVTDFQVNFTDSEIILQLQREYVRDSLYLLVYSLTGIVALMGNAVVVHVVFTIPNMRTFVHILLANMAISDIICALSFFVGLLLCSDILIVKCGIGFCVANKAVQLLTFQVSSLTMTVVAIDRWISVFFPFYHKTCNTHAIPKVTKVVTALWLISLAIIVGTSPSLGVQRYFTPRQALIKCQFSKAFYLGESSVTIQRLQLIIANLAHFWVPLAVISATYGSIGIKVWKRHLGNDLAKSQIDLLMVQKWKTIKMLIAAVAVFIFCWVPFFILNLIAFSKEPSKKRPCNQSLLYLIVIWLAFSSCCYNPIVYWIYNKTYRNGISNLIRLPLSTQSSQEPICHRPTVP